MATPIDVLQRQIQELREQNAEAQREMKEVKKEAAKVLLTSMKMRQSLAEQQDFMFALLYSVCEEGKPLQIKIENFRAFMSKAQFQCKAQLENEIFEAEIRFFLNGVPESEQQQKDGE